MLIRAALQVSLLLLIITTHDAYTQQVTINVENEKLSTVFKLIEDQVDIKFAYNAKKIDAETLITLSKSGELGDILEALLKPLDLQFEFLEKQIIIKPKTSKPPDKGTLNGYIKDGKNGEALIGASVYFKDLNIGTITNAFGFFSLPLPNGEHEMSISYIGYEDYMEQIIVDGGTSLTVQLSESTPILNEVVITAAQTPFIDEVLMSKDKIRPKTVEDMPALLGEVDVIKSLEFIPGVKAHSDGSTFYYVRGGNRDQNLIIVDDAPIFNSSHLLGIFSTVIPDAVNTVDIYKGNMPASLGGRLSSIIDIRTKKGNEKDTEVWGNLGLISTKLGIEGPIKKDISSYLISFRGSRVKWLFDEQIQDLNELNFYDFTGKVNFKSGEKNNFYVSLYLGEDSYFIDNEGIEWSNAAGSFRWNRILGEKLFMNTTLSASSYEYFLTTDLVNNSVWKSRVATLGLKSDFTYFKNENSIIDFGIGINGYNFNPGNLTTDDPNVQPPVISVKNSSELVLYGNHELRINEKFGINYGLRLTSWANQGGSFEFLFDEDYNVADTLFFDAGESYSQFGNPEPRISLSYFVNEQSTLKFSYARNVQNMHLISNSISPFTSLEVWLPSSFNIEPQIANQIALGYSRSFTKSGLVFNVEAYYKKMLNQIDYQPHAETLLNPLLEGELRFGEGQAAGIEFLLKKEQGRLRGWAGYTLSKATGTFSEINNGVAFDAFYDRPHEINLVLAYDLTDRLVVGSNWTYFTGSAFSAPIGFYSYNGLEAPIYGEKNNTRLPDYHRMDVSATYQLNRNPNNRFKHDLSLSIYNLYGRKNSLFINYNKTETESGDLRIPSNLLEGNRTTTQSYFFRFTPSISYNFRF